MNKNDDDQIDKLLFFKKIVYAISHGKLLNASFRNWEYFFKQVRYRSRYCNHSTYDISENTSIRVTS